MSNRKGPQRSTDVIENEHKQLLILDVLSVMCFGKIALSVFDKYHI